MVSIGNILKVVGTIIAGYIVGLLGGATLGAMLGVLISFFIREIVLPQQAIMISLFVCLTLGSMLSLFASQIFNALLETNINSFVGAIPGALVGLVVVFFVYGIIDISDPNSYQRTITINRFTLTPVMSYSAGIGGQIGAIIFPFFGAAGVIREIINSHLELKRNRELRQGLPADHWGFPESPAQKQPASQANPLPRPAPAAQKPIGSAKEHILRFFVKAFGLACALGAVLSIAGWQILGWNSSAQFSDGFFLASAAGAMFGYFHLLGERKVSRNLTMRYGETVGDMNIHERTRQWAIDAESSFMSFPSMFLMSAFLFGFAIFISTLF